MRRIMIIGAAAVAVLAVAGVAYAAAFNSYSAKLTFSPSKAGSKSQASPLAFTENLGATGTGGNRAAPLVVELSSDRSAWTKAAQRDTSFVTWTAQFPPTTARYVRLRVARRTFLHLENVSIR